MPDGVRTSVVTVKTADGAAAPGVLYAVDPGETVVALMHPRLDLSRHYLIPILLEAGYSVWAQGTHALGNDCRRSHNSPS